MKGDAKAYRKDEKPMLNITKRGKRIWDGIGEVGAGDATGSVAGGCDVVVPFEAARLILAISTYGMVLMFTGGD